MMLNAAMYNRHKFQVHYLSSEMRAGGFKRRLQKSDQVLIKNMQSVRFYEGVTDFVEAIVPGRGNLNLLDYIKLIEEPWKIGRILSDIEEKLDGAMCIASIQKRPGSTSGVGGVYTEFTPSLVVACEKKKDDNYNVALVTKIRELNDDYLSDNNFGVYYKHHFNIIDGIKIISKTGWHR